MKNQRMQKIRARISWSMLYLLLDGLIFVLGLNLLELVPKQFQDIYKLGLPIILLMGYLAALKYYPDQEIVFLAFFLVSAGWTLDYYLTGIFKDLFALNSERLSGFAYIMLISTCLVSIPVVIGWLLCGQKLPVIFIQGSQKRWGILLGSVGLILFGGLGVLQSLGQGLTINIIGAAIPLALLFSLANAFREELVYRAVFLRGFQANIGIAATVIITTIIFTFAHIDVSYTTANLIVFFIVLVIISLVGCLIMLKTGSLIGSVLFHAGADVLLILGMLTTYQLTIP